MISTPAAAPPACALASATVFQNSCVVPLGITATCFVAAPERPSPPAAAASSAASARRARPVRRGCAVFMAASVSGGRTCSMAAGRTAVMLTRCAHPCLHLAIVLAATGAPLAPLAHAQVPVPTPPEAQAPSPTAAPTPAPTPASAQPPVSAGVPLAATKVPGRWEGNGLPADTDGVAWYVGGTALTDADRAADLTFMPGRFDDDDVTFVTIRSARPPAGTAPANTPSRARCCAPASTASRSASPMPRATADGSAIRRASADAGGPRLRLRPQRHVVDRRG